LSSTYTPTISRARYLSKDTNQALHLTCQEKPRHDTRRNDHQLLETPTESNQILPCAAFFSIANLEYLRARFFCYVEMMEKATKKATKTLPNPKNRKKKKKRGNRRCLFVGYAG